MQMVSVPLAGPRQSLIWKLFQEDDHKRVVYSDEVVQKHARDVHFAKARLSKVLSSKGGLVAKDTSISALQEKIGELSMSSQGLLPAICMEFTGQGVAKYNQASSFMGNPVFYTTSGEEFFRSYDQAVDRVLQNAKRRSLIPQNSLFQPVWDEENGYARVVYLFPSLLRQRDPVAKFIIPGWNPRVAKNIRFSKRMCLGAKDIIQRQDACGNTILTAPLYLMGID